MNQIAIIGDVHGCANQLRRLLSRSELCDRKLILTGDFINRGPDSARVVETIIEAKSHREVIHLLGNHEIALLRYLRTGDLLPFALAGGIATIKSYLRQSVRSDVKSHFLESIPVSHLELICSSDIYYEDDDVFVSHVGPHPLRLNSRSMEDVVLLPHPELFAENMQLPKLTVCGHYGQSNKAPFVSKNGSFVCIDTGCGNQGALLTALLLPEFCFIQI